MKINITVRFSKILGTTV